MEAAPALNRLFPEGLPLTRRWTSHGTRYHLLFKYDARLAKYGKRIIKGQRDAKTGKILGNPAYLGLELRIGTTHPADQSQIQSVIPPSRKSDGTPRRWDGPAELLDLPESVFADLDKYASRPSATANPPAQERARPTPARPLKPVGSPNGHNSGPAAPLGQPGGIMARLAEIFGPDYNPNNAEPEEESGPDNPNDATYEDTSIPEELRPWTHGKDLDAILSIYLGQTIDTSSEPKLIDPESKLYGLYLAVRSQSGTARVVQKWYKSEVPGNLRAAWWSYWKKRIK